MVSKVREIDVLRPLLLIGVVLIHCTPLQWMPQAAPHPDAAAEVLQFFVTQALTAFVVPMYFVIGGYLFFTSRRSYFSKIRRRCLTLLVPYLLWNTLALVAAFTVNRSLPLSLSAIAGYYFFDPLTINPVMWFIRDLFIACLVAPLIGFVLRLKYVGAGVLMVGGYVAGLGWLIWFTAGAWIAIGRVRVEVLEGRLWVSVLAWLLMSVILTYIEIFSGKDDMVKSIAYLGSVVSGMMMAWIFAARFVGSGRSLIRPVKRSAFFIYAFHGVIIATQIVHKYTAMAIASSSVGAVAVAIVVLFAAMYFGSFGVYLLADKLMPRVVGVLTGFRSDGE